MRRRGITRLCHFTPSRNLVHIASSGAGLLSTQHLKAEERSVFTPTDLQRLDAQEGAVSCSVEYPNSWYFDRVRDRDTVFKDWVVLLIDPQYLWRDGTLFCPRNAAANFGREVQPGYEAFMKLYSAAVQGAYGKTYKRAPQHLLASPTDDQAEVLVPDAILWTDVFGFVVRDKSQAKRELLRLQMLQVEMNTVQIVISSTLYDKYELSRSIRLGKRPAAIAWIPE